jgi:hypothetical protein
MHNTTHRFASHRPFTAWRSGAIAIAALAAAAVATLSGCSSLYTEGATASAGIAGAAIAAKALGVSLKTLYNRLSSYGPDEDGSTDDESE